MSFYLKLFICVFLFCLADCAIRDPIPSQLHECNVEEISLLKDVFNELRSEGFLEHYARIHVHHFNSAHGDPMHFFSFHGHMLRDLELKMRMKDKRIEQLPAWNITATPIVPAYFTYLTLNWREIERPRGVNTPIPPQTIGSLYQLNYRTNFMDFVRQCSLSHDATHNWYRGTFGSPWSPRDPMFWFFHKYFDNLYVNWATIHNQPIMTYSNMIPPIQVNAFRN